MRIHCTDPLQIWPSHGTGARVESKRTSGDFHLYRLFVFGDSFADTGNIPKSDLSRGSRQWYSPYGSNRPLQNGRFSDGYVQTDLVGNNIETHFRLNLFINPP